MKELTTINVKTSNGKLTSNSPTTSAIATNCTIHWTQQCSYLPGQPISYLTSPGDCQDPKSITGMHLLHKT